MAVSSLFISRGQRVSYALLSKAEEIVEERGEIDTQGANELATIALDLNHYSQVEKDTVAQIRRRMPWSAEGDRQFRSRIASAARTNSVAMRAALGTIEPKLPGLIAKTNRRTGRDISAKKFFSPKELIGAMRFVQDQVSLIRSDLASQHPHIDLRSKKSHTYYIRKPLVLNDLEQDITSLNGERVRLLDEDYFGPASADIRAVAGVMLEEALNKEPSLKGVRFRVYSKSELEHRGEESRNIYYRLVAKRTG